MNIQARMESEWILQHEEKQRTYNARGSESLHISTLRTKCVAASLESHCPLEHACVPMYNVNSYWYKMV